MNKDLVTINEVVNDGSCIFFYQEEMTGAWVTYGYSAYLLAQIVQCRFVSSFSKLMQMPCVCIAASDFRNLVRANVATMECLDNFYQLPCSTTVCDDKYQQWVQDLKANTL